MRTTPGEGWLGGVFVIVSGRRGTIAGRRRIGARDGGRLRNLATSAGGVRRLRTVLAARRRCAPIRRRPALASPLSLVAEKQRNLDVRAVGGRNGGPGPAVAQQVEHVAPGIRW